MPEPGAHIRGLARSAAAALGLGIAGAAHADIPTVDEDAPIDREIGMRLPAGLSATVFHDGLGRVRHIAVTADGTLYARLREPTGGGAIAALRDGEGDGMADEVAYFHDDAGGTGIAVHDGWLYASSDVAVVRWRLPEDGLVPEGPPETVVDGFPVQRSHASKAFAIDREGALYVNVGAPSNSCQEEDRTKGSPAMDPCPLRERQAALWRFDADRTGQVFGRDGHLHVAGVRNVVGLDAHPETGELFFGQHGRDMLHTLFPELYSQAQNRDLPAEEFHVAVEGADLGWPYSYWDGALERRVLAPEYGGDGTVAPDDADRYQDPLIAFPAHWAPNGLLIYTGDALPEAFRGGAFLAWHGSWNRQPFEQSGYKVTFLPFEDGRPTGDWHVFADGFPGEGRLARSADAERRPMGLAQGPDGALYIADSVQGRIWRVTASDR